MRRRVVRAPRVPQAPRVLLVPQVLLAHRGREGTTEQGARGVKKENQAKTVPGGSRVRWDMRVKKEIRVTLVKEGRWG